MPRKAVWGLALLLLLAGAAQAEERVIIRDAQGRRQGTVEKGVGDRQVIRDEQGKRIGTVEPGVGGRQIIRDAQGRRVGSLEKR